MDIVTLADYENAARQRLGANAWAYLAGGAGDETTLRENRAAFARLLVEPRILRSFDHAHTGCRLLGQDLAHPILLAPAAYHHLFHPEGELATVAGAGAMDAVAVVSSQASTPLESIAAAATAPLWWQLYFQRDRSATLDLVRRVEAAGYGALVLTVDAPLSGIRDREAREHFHLPPGIAAVNLPPPPPQAVPGTGEGGRPLLLDHLPPMAGWDDISWLVAEARVPVLLKGVLNPDDAQQAVELGVAGLVVSNHGGRTLDTVPATLDALGPIAERLSGAVPLLVDGGIRRGTDVLKAIALGADAVLIGRPYLHGLAVAGALGVAHVVKMLRIELEVAMVLAGCPTLADARSLNLFETVGG
ncbi:MAG TPA: alpha-hydroxy acid oxidase [Bacteroidia bacterium]|nr:alpha-hydroxy acid oxidase [Bacteroidia bacterium]